MKLFVSDLDGTLLDNKCKVTKSSADKINRAIENGALFSVATARSASSALELVKEININAPIIMMNGVFIYDIVKNKYLSSQVISPEISEEIVFLTREYSDICRMLTFNSEGIDVFCTSKDLYNILKPEEIKPHKTIHFTNDLSKHLHTDSVVSFVITGSFDIVAPIFKQIRYDERLSLTFYEDVYEPQKFWLEIHSANTDKAKALAKVKRITGATHITAFGDNLNDIEMLEFADVGCAPSNSVTPAKEAADIVLLKSNDEDAVADYIIGAMEK